MNIADRSRAGSGCQRIVNRCFSTFNFKNYGKACYNFLPFFSKNSQKPQKVEKRNFQKQSVSYDIYTILSRKSSSVDKMQINQLKENIKIFF